MATSPSHQLGEFIGDFFELAIIKYLSPIVSKNGYYLDYRHPRPARGNKREVIGVDHNGNKHKLDIVVEENGSEARFGTPKAFIEMAWRRYVKHSKNKVQEIAGAILPLVETHANRMPFYAAVLAGEFTKNSLVQLRSQGFFVLYFNYAEICRLFDTAGISIRWEESTSDSELQRIAEDFQALTDKEKVKLLHTFYTMYATQLAGLANALMESLSTTIAEVLIVPIHGAPHVVTSISDAVLYITNYNESANKIIPILRYEITVRYSNGDEYTMKCANKSKAIQFLRQYS